MGYRALVRPYRPRRDPGERRDADDDGKPDAGSANAGAQTTYTLKVKSNQGSLRSLSLAAPAGFYVGSATSSSGNPQAAGNQTVNVTGLNISGSNTVTVSIAAFPKCTPGSPNTWTLNAAQNGGTTYVPVPFSTTRHAAVELQARVRADRRPDQEHRGHGRRSRWCARTTRSTPPTPIPISLSIENDPGNTDATLTGGGATVPANGVATFSTSLNVAGTGYVLEACSPTVNNVHLRTRAGGRPGFLSGALRGL